MKYLVILIMLNTLSLCDQKFNYDFTSNVKYINVDTPIVAKSTINIYHSYVSIYTDELLYIDDIKSYQILSEEEFYTEYKINTEKGWYIYVQHNNTTGEAENITWLTDKGNVIRFLHVYKPRLNK